MMTNLPDKADTSELDLAIAEYADLEMAVAGLIDGRMNHVCAACRKPCCRADVCAQAVECWFLLQVSRHVHGKWWPDDWRSRKDPFALSAGPWGPLRGGCLLKAGRPLICRSFVCDAYVASYDSLWEAVLMCFASDLLWQAGRITATVSVESLDEDRAAAYAGKLRRKLDDARKQLDLAMMLMDPAATELDKHRVALKLLCLVPRCFRATMRRAILDRLGGVAG
jgi:hypothetical protein